MRSIPRLFLSAGVWTALAMAVGAPLRANPPAVAERKPIAESSDFIRRYGSSAFRVFAPHLEYSPDGRLLAAADFYRRTIDVLDAKTGEARFTLKTETQSGSGIGFSPDGDELAFRNQARVTIWQSQDGKLRRTDPDGNARGSIYSQKVAISPDRKWWAILSGSEIVLTRWNQFEPVHRIPFKGNYYPSLAIGHDGRWVAAADARTASLHVWKAPKFDAPLEWKPAESPVQALAASPDGKTLYAACKDGSIHARSMELDRDGTRLFHIHNNTIRFLLASPDQKHLAVGRYRAVLLCEIATGRTVHTIPWDRSGEYSNLAFSPDGSTLTIGSASQSPIELWNVKTGQRINKSVPPIENVFALDDPQRFGSRYYGMISLWNWDTGRIEESFPYNEQGPGGKAISGSSLFRGTEQITITSREGEVYYRDFSKARAFKRLAGLSPIHPVRRAYSSRRVSATLLGLGSFRLNKFTFSTREPRPTFRQILHGPASRCLHFGFSADGNTFAAAFADQSVFIWEPETGQERQRLQLDESPSQILMNSDGSQLAGLNGNTIDVWDLEAGKKLHQLPLARDEHHVMSFGFKKDLFATASSETGIRIWSLKTGKEVLALDPPDSAVVCLAFSPDDKQLALGLNDTSIRLFDLANRSETARLAAHSGPVTHILFHPDGEQLVSGSEKWELIHWDLSAQKPRVTKRILGGIKDLFWTVEDRALMIEDARGRLFFIQDLEKPALAHALNETDVPYERHFAYAKNTGQLALANTWGIRVLDTKTQRETAFLPEPNVRALEWAEDGRTLVVASAGVFGWDVVEQKEVYRISNAEIKGGVTSLAKSPDGKIAAGGISTQKVCFWDLATGRLIREVSLARKIEGPGWWFITSVQFSSDGRLLFAMARDLYFVIEVESGLVWFEKPNQDPADTSFALIGHDTLLSAEPKGTARLWSWAPARSLRNDESPERLWRGLTGHDGPTVYRAMFALAELKDEAVEFLNGQLSEIRNPGTTPEKIASLIADLDEPAPDARRNASEILRELGSATRSQLKKTLERENLSARTRSRIQILLAAQDREADPDLLAIRGVQILEWIGTRKAREALERLANDPTDRLGREAKAALRRLSPPTG